MNLSLKTFIFLLFTQTLIAQDFKQNIIRIVGNCTETFQYTDLSVKIKITEVQPDQYRQIRYKSIEQIKAELVEKLKQSNFNTNDIRSDFDYKNYRGNYDKTITEHITLRLKNLAEAEKIYKLSVDGVSVEKIDFDFNQITQATEDKMAQCAVEDAKRKAEALAKQNNKKSCKKEFFYQLLTYYKYS
jgi:uncharacterized protein YggE